MSKILGLDLGTNSIGWAVVEKENNAFKFAECNGKPAKGVVIFPEGLKIEKGNEKSRAAERTEYRSSRKLKFRRKLRKYNTLKTLIEQAPIKMCPLTSEGLNWWRQSINQESGKKESFKQYPKSSAFRDWLKTDELTHKNPYYFRDKFSRKKYDWENDQKLAYELGRAFYHLAQRRGFKSNRLEQTDENIISDVKERIQDELNHTENIRELYQNIEYLFQEYDFNKRTQEELDDTEKQLKKIWNYLSKVLNNKLKGKDYSDFEDIKKEIDRYINRPENLGPVKGGIKTLNENIEKADCNTLGQYFWHLYQKDRNHIDHKIRKHYTAREEHYEHEFETICQTQQIPQDLKEKLYNAIFYQRPLKSQKGLVGTCTFEKDKPRCPVSRPEFEEYRMWCFINSIKIKTPQDDQLRFLSEEEKELIIPKFYRQKSHFKFSDLTNTLKSDADFKYYKEREAKHADFQVNYKLNTTVSGCPVSAAFKSLLGDDWKSKTFSYDAKNKKGETVSRNVNYQDLWHILFTFQDDKKVKAFAAEKLEWDEKEVRKFSKIELQQGYSNLSLKAIKKILHWLKKGLIYSHAVFMANLEKVVDADVWNNEDNRKLIEDEIGKIIDSHTDETKRINAINSLIKEYRGSEEYVEFSQQAEQSFRNDLEQKLVSVFGKAKWDKKVKEQPDIFEKTFQLLKGQLEKIKSKDAFIQIKRIDEEVADFLTGNHFVSNERQLSNLYHPSDLQTFKPEKAKNNNDEEISILPSPKTDAIKNPVLMRAMHQLRKLVNTLLKEGIIDHHTKIHLEMAREVNDANKRAAWKKWQDDNRDQREDAVQEIKKMYYKETGKEIEPDQDDITRYILWIEQGKKEIYEDPSNNICISDIIGADPSYDIEHTIPRSISWDNSMMNKTLCSKKYNREVKVGKAPFELGKEKQEELLNRLQHWKNYYEELDKQIKNINAGSITDKAQKDKAIQKKNYLQLERDYWKGKYDRFAMEEVTEGFKNSQIVDTGLITRYARNYLSCLFKTGNDNSNVFVVNGGPVDQFRRAWGLQDEYEKKSRQNHIHHCIDAITIACMTKEKYDEFVEAWRKAEEQQEKYDVKSRIKINKPWPTFTEDIKNLENEIMVVHAHKDNVPKQTKKKLRKRGKIQYKDEAKTKPIYLKGDSARGSLHQETYYGAIKSNGNGHTQYVVRKELADVKDADIPKIVDKKVREVVTNARTEEKRLNKEIESLKKEKKKADGEKETELQNKINEIQEYIKHNLYTIPPKPGKNKATPIRKVRIYAKLNEPLPEFKKHRDAKLNENNNEKYPHKSWYYVQNDENYCLALYESHDHKKRAAEIVKMIDAADYFKLSNQKHKNNNPLVVPSKKNLPLKGFLQPAKLVLFYKNYPEEIWELDQEKLSKRMYSIKKTNKDGRVTFQYHQEARNDDGLKRDYKEYYNTEPPKSLTNGESNIDFDRIPIPKLLISPANMNVLIEGIDFKISPIGEILKL